MSLDLDECLPLEQSRIAKSFGRNCTTLGFRVSILLTYTPIRASLGGLVLTLVSDQNQAPALAEEHAGGPAFCRRGAPWGCLLFLTCRGSGLLRGPHLPLNSRTWAGCSGWKEQLAESWLFLPWDQSCEVHSRLCRRCVCAYPTRSCSSLNLG